MGLNSSFSPTTFLLDVDGVLTNGQFFYSPEGKQFKVFGPDDNDGLGLLKPYLNIQFITGDKKGFNISHKRIVDDMGYNLDLVSTIHRIDWIKAKFDPAKTIYMGDGIFDHFVMQEVVTVLHHLMLMKMRSVMLALLQSDQVAIEQLLRHVFIYFPASSL